MQRALEQTIRIKGSVHMLVRDAQGRVKDERLVENLVVNVGLAWIAGALSGDEGTPTDMKYIGCGTGTNAANATDTALQTEVESRATGSQSRVTTDTTNDTYQCVGTVSMTGTHAITEAGLLSASSGGTLGSRQVFSAINVVNGDSIQFTWKWDFD